MGGAKAPSFCFPRKVCNSLCPSWIEQDLHGQLQTESQVEKEVGWGRKELGKERGNPKSIFVQPATLKIHRRPLASLMETGQHNTALGAPVASSGYWMWYLVPTRCQILRDLGINLLTNILEQLPILWATVECRDNSEGVGVNIKAWEWGV